MQRNVLATVLAAVMIGAVAGPAMAAAPAAGSAASGLAVDVTQSDDVTVTVTDNGTGAANATVEMTTVDSNATYNGTGTYETRPNGTVSLPAPTEHVEVSVTATRRAHPSTRVRPMMTTATTTKVAATARRKAGISDGISDF